MPSPLEEMGVFINDSLLMSREDCVCVLEGKGGRKDKRE